MELIDALLEARSEVSLATAREENCRVQLREDLVSRAEIAWCAKRSIIKSEGLWHKYPAAATWYIEVYILIYALIGLLRLFPLVGIRGLLDRILQYTEKPAPVWT
jgi:hypothetical protein